MNRKIVFNIRNSQLLILDINDIIYFEKSDRKVKARLRNYPKEILININIKKLCLLLEEKNFYNVILLKPHCSYVVNINYIKIINPHNIIMINGDELPISNNKRADFLKKLKELFDK